MAIWKKEEGIQNAEKEVERWREGKNSAEKVGCLQELIFVLAERR